jgi:hypothetical protein
MFMIWYQKVCQGKLVLCYQYVAQWYVFHQRKLFISDKWP